MLDVSGSMQGNLPLLRAAAEQLIATLGPDDLPASARSGTRLASVPRLAIPRILRALARDRSRCANAALARLDEAMNAFAG